MADASSLIHPAKVARFWALMKATFEQILIPEAVYQEVLHGREIGSPDVPVIQRAVDERWISVRKVVRKARLPENLGAGEQEAISLMLQEKVDWLLMDDRVASTTARLLGLEVRPAVYLLVYWTRKRIANAATALDMLDQLVKRGYRLGADDYVTIKDLVAGGRATPRRIQSP